MWIVRGEEAAAPPANPVVTSPNQVVLPPGEDRARAPVWCVVLLRGPVEPGRHRAPRPPSWWRRASRGPVFTLLALGIGALTWLAWDVAGGSVALLATGSLRLVRRRAGSTRGSRARAR
ncbi:hypothetical protein Acsp05_55830 [Actinokineospora sp. NBRC 105648]|nr:hypothetical protein Acsp05_55830 [Actinokineospora sp. NBRC 105648]